MTVAHEDEYKGFLKHGLAEKGQKSVTLPKRKKERKRDRKIPPY